VLDRIGLSRSRLYRKLGDGSFPPPERLKPRCVNRRDSRVECWIMSPYGYRTENDNDGHANDNDLTIWEAVMGRMKRRSLLAALAPWRPASIAPSFHSWPEPALASHALLPPGRVLFASIDRVPIVEP
jgi:prophage regulatory protein